MRNLKFAILGLISRQPMTGYDIMKSFEDRALSNFWYAKHSQIYPELKILVDEGLLNYKTVIQGEKLEKKLYTITTLGKQEFQKWLYTDCEIEPTPKDIFRLKTYFSDNLSTDEYLNMLENQLKQHESRINYLYDVMNLNFSKIPDSGTPELGDYMVLDGAIEREQAYIKWLKKCIKIVK